MEECLVIKVDIYLVTRYTGHRYDPVVGMYYARFRMYDPNIRRFTAIDPIRGTVLMPHTMVQYTYVLNNPVRYIDPWGLFCRASEGYTWSEEQGTYLWNYFGELSNITPPPPPCFQWILEEVYEWLGSMTDDELMFAIGTGLFEAMGVYVPSDWVRDLASGGHMDFNDIRQDLVGWIADTIIEDSSGQGIDLLNGWGYFPGNSWHQKDAEDPIQPGGGTGPIAIHGAPNFGIPNLSVPEGLGLATAAVALWNLARDAGQVIVDSWQEGFRQISREVTGVAQAGGITVDGQTITFNEVNYVADVKANAIVLQAQDGRFYPAMRYGGYIMVAPIAISDTIAQGIMLANDPIVGVFTIQGQDARRLADHLGGAVWDDRHQDRTGYWPHYHFLTPSGAHSDSHAWFFAERSAR